MNVKEQIIDALRATGRENIENVITYMENNSFFSCACNRHHDYAGGLADHSWQTYRFALKAVEESGQNDVDTNSLAVCTLLHDFCKCKGMDEFRNGHGNRSYQMLDKLGLDLSDDEYLAIRFHMNLEGYENDPRYEDAKNCILRQIVHVADVSSLNTKTGVEVN